MKNYHPDSWSKQARDLCDLIISQDREVDDALHFFQNSYRAPIIRQRAAKRYGRYVKANHLTFIYPYDHDWYD